MNISVDTIRGAGIGVGQVYHRGEESRVTEYEPRRRETFTCPSGHVFTKDFHALLDQLPSEWVCARCSALALRTGAEAPSGEQEGEPHTPVRPGCWYTFKHRKDVFERRTEDELRALVSERLALLRAAR